MCLFGNDVRLIIIGCGPILRASRSPMRHSCPNYRPADSGCYLHTDQ